MTITYTSQSNLTIQGTAFTGDAGDCIVFDSCTNITVRRCHFTASAGVGLKFNSCAGTILIENCYFDDLNGGIYLFNTTATLTVRENHCGDVARAGKLDGSRGQFIQANACTLAGGLITDNYVRFDEGGGDKEDHISMFDTSGTSGSPLVISNNWLRGRHTSTSGGCILVGEGDGNYIHILTNTIINPGVAGVAVAGGAFNVVDGNLMYSETFSTND
ncbi:MAG: right-handed parallel beta-helix repeat-containing protein, partial [Burkholderiaceae bacterium]